LYLSTGARLARHRITQAHPADTAATSQPSALVTLVSAGNRLDTEKPTTAITPRASRNELSAYIRDSKTTIRAITARETPVSTSNAKSRLRLKEPIKIMVAAPIVVVRSAGDRITLSPPELVPEPELMPVAIVSDTVERIPGNPTAIRTGVRVAALLPPLCCINRRAIFHEADNLMGIMALHTLINPDERSGASAANSEIRQSPRRIPNIATPEIAASTRSW
jgi:hypothetical protein